MMVSCRTQEALIKLRMQDRYTHTSGYTTSLPSLSSPDGTPISGLTGLSELNTTGEVAMSGSESSSFPL
jgi:hypothetical protein